MLFLYFGKRNFVIFSQKEGFLIFWEMKLSCIKIKTFQERLLQTQKNYKTHSEKISYISGSGIFYLQV